MNKTKEIILLLCIVFLACILRFWSFGQVPPSPDWDEVALGYNAYSIMETGKDEYGQDFPFVLRSFDDYKPGLYAYLVIPFIKLFGLTVVAVRIPSALFGIFTVIAAYFIVKELVLYDKEVTWKKRALPFTAMFLLAISPWHIQFSRIAFESNVGLSLNVFSILFFLKGLKKPYLLLFCVLCMGFSLYAYQAEKVFVPILAFIFVVLFIKQLLAFPKKYLFLSIIVGIVVALPILLYTLTSKAALTRAQGVSIFTDQTPFVKDYTNRIIIDKENNDIFGLLLDNRRIAFAKALITGYLSHYSLNWLFISGDIERHHAPQMGLLYLWELPFLLVGIYQLIFGNFDKRMKFFVFLWFFAAPIPASFTTGIPHAVRTLNFLPTFQILTAIGILTVIVHVWQLKYRILIIKIRYAVVTVYLLFFSFNFLYFLNQYFVQQKYFYSQAWQYGYEEAILDIKKIEDKYDKIIVSNKPHLDQSYIFFLFYLKYPPQLYQKEAKNVSGGFREDHRFGRYEFRTIDWDNERKNGRTLYVGRPADFGGGLKLMKVVTFLDGEEAIWIVQG